MLNALLNAAARRVRITLPRRVWGPTADGIVVEVELEDDAEPAADANADADTTDGRTEPLLSRKRPHEEEEDDEADCEYQQRKVMHEAIACITGLPFHVLPPRFILQRCITPRTNTFNLLPMCRRVRTHFDTTHHDYYLDDVLLTSADWWYSPSGFKEILWPPFDEDHVAGRMVKNGTKNVVYVDTLVAAVEALRVQHGVVGGPTAAEIVQKGTTDPLYVSQLDRVIKDMWEENRNAGSASHAAEDAWLQGDPDADVPDGFLKAMAKLAPRFDVFRTEMTLIDEVHRVKGQADLVLRDRATGELTIADHKHCRVLREDAERYGTHFVSEAWPDTKMGHYQFQLSVYRWVLLHAYGLPMSDEVILLNYPPDRPGELEIERLPALDLTAFFALLPWRGAADPRHEAPWPARAGAPYLVPPLPEDDETTTTTARGRAQDAATDPAHYAWVEHKWKNLPKSCWAHPRRWFGKKGPPLGARGEYERHLLTSRELLYALPSLVGKALVCWCPASAPCRCHARVLRKYVRAYERGEVTLPWDPLQF